MIQARTIQVRMMIRVRRGWRALHGYMLYERWKREERVSALPVSISRTLELGLGRVRAMVRAMVRARGLVWQ